MLLVKTYVAPACNKGLGLFAAQAISKGQMIWRFIDGIDRRFNYYGKDPMIIEFLDKYACRRGDIWEVCLDNARFMNHSNNPNTQTIGDDIDYAIVDINEGQEITIDYRKIDDMCSNDLGFRNWE